MADKKTNCTTEEAAKEYFRQGFNCCESVFRAFLDTHDTGLPADAACISTGFGGGVGSSKTEICGAVSAAEMSLGTVIGRRGDADLGDKDKNIEYLHTLYPEFEKMLSELREELGSARCADLTADYGDFHSLERRRHCKDIVAACAKKADEFAAAHGMPEK